jgi:thiol-disulfide isomerase/thioredoxin
MSFLQKFATPILVLLAIPALLIVLGLNGMWQPAVKFTSALGLTPVVGSGSNLGPMPDWKLPDLNSAPVTSADYKGKVVLINFWSTWCPPCVAEIPGFIQVQDEYRAKGLTILGFSMDEGDPQVVRDFVKANGINYPILRGDSRVAQAFGGVNGIPASFLVDQKGQIVLHHTGILSAKALRAAVDPLLPR